MDEKPITEEIDTLITAIRDIPKKFPENEDGSFLISWYTEIDRYKKEMLRVIKLFFKDNSPYLAELDKIPVPSFQTVSQERARFADRSCMYIGPLPALGAFYMGFAVPAVHLLETIKLELEKSPRRVSDSNGFEKVYRICTRFKLIADQLKERYDNRETLIIKDEHDVQDLFHALLKLYFDDIRPEEPTPSTAGSSSRIDFLLTRERILIETKMPRSSLGDKKLKEELIIDLECYQKHPGFDTLIFFVYDPDRYIQSPGAFETDFNEVRDDLCVRFLISQ